MLYKETNFKTVEELEMPRDWNGVKLQDILTYTKGRKPESYLTSQENNSTPYLSTEYLRQSIATQFVIPNEKLIKASAGDVLLLWDGSNAGEFFISKDGVLSTTMVKFELKNDNIDKQFLFYLLKTKESYIKSQTNGTGIPHVSPTILNSLTLALPPFAEQQKIVKLLSNIDVAIEKTDKLITTTEKLRMGLIEQVVTKGLNHKKFKKVEIRTRIYNLPEEWRISNLSETSTIKGRIGWQGLTTKEYLKDGEYLLVTGTDFENGRIAWDRCVYVSKERYMQDTNIQLKEGDILITKDGTIGKIAYVDKLPQQATLNSGIFVVRPVNSAYGPSYMFWIMQSKFFNVFMNILKAGSTISHLYQRDFVNFEFPIPPLEEQQKIVKILSTVDHQLDLERKEKRHLERVKSGLMDKLLSGRVRVK